MVPPLLRQGTAGVARGVHEFRFKKTETPGNSFPQIKGEEEGYC